MRYLNLTLGIHCTLQSVPESASSSGVARQLGDFDWDSTGRWIPHHNFNDTNVNSEVASSTTTQEHSPPTSNNAWRTTAARPLTQPLLA
jgi:hypothetical protein